jgi:hypothetical protein
MRKPSADFEPVSEADLFDLEYWSLEAGKARRRQAKTAHRPGRARHRRSGRDRRGHGKTVRGAEGAHVVVLDLDGDKGGGGIAKAAGNGSIGVGCDVTDPLRARRL